MIKNFNNKSEKVWDDLKKSITKWSKLDIAAAIFSIYGYESLKKELNNIEQLRFIFTDPTFVEIDKKSREQKMFEITSNNIKKAIGWTNFEINLKNKLKWKAIAKECREWIEKKVSLLKANTPINKTLRPCREDSVNFDITENLYIEWDNFEVLKILQESYLWKVKMIYIDPPYNTWKDFVYKDNFKVSKEDYEDDLWVEDEEGWKLFKNTDTNGRFHSDWLSMMYERLIVARDLLKDDWVIFMSIDENEIHNLKKISDEIYWEENYIWEFIWNNRTTPNDAQCNFASTHEYILIYWKTNNIIFKWLEKDFSNYKNSDNDINWDWIADNPTAASWNYKFEIKNPFTWEIYTPPVWRYWAFSEKRVEEWYKSWKLLFPKVNWKNFLLKKYKKDLKSDFKPIPSIINWILTSIWAKERKELFPEWKFFDYPKPTILIKYLLNQTLQVDDLVIDFFSWSATTAHAVMQLNAEDGGNRKFVMVQIPEETDEKSEAFKAWYKNICEIWKERIRRAGKKIIEENEEKLKERKEKWIKDLDTWFRVYKTDSSNMKDVFYHPSELEQWNLLDVVSNIKEDRSSEDLLTQVILDLGLTLDMPIEKKEILWNTVYFVAWNSLVACFDENIDFWIVDEIAKEEPLRVVFRDSCFKTDSDRINFENRFKKLSVDSEIRVI